MLSNLQKMRVSTQSWHRPRGLPPPLPHDLDCVLEGATLLTMEAMVDDFLKGTHRNMCARGFDSPPLSYAAPRIYLQKDRHGEVTNSRFFPSWDKEEHATLFYMLWRDFHWTTSSGAEVQVLKLHNPKMDRLTDKPYARCLMFEPDKMEPDAYLKVFDQWMRDNCLTNTIGASSSSGGGQLRLADSR